MGSTCARRRVAGAVVAAAITAVAVLSALSLVGGSRASDGASPTLADITWEKPLTAPVADITWERPVPAGLVADITWELMLDPTRPHA